MAHWTDRKKAALRRMWLRPKPTPKSEVRAMRCNMDAEQDMEDEQVRLVEGVLARAKPEPKGKVKPKVKGKSVAKEMSEEAMFESQVMADDTIVVSVPKSKAPVAKTKPVAKPVQKVAKVEKDPHVHDFYERGDE